MDPSELLPIVLAVIVAGLAFAGLVRARRVAAKGLRWGSVVGTALVGIASLLVAGALVFFDLNYTRHLPGLAAPDGKHVAITSYTVNTGAGVDEAEVAIRAPWSPYAHRVYSGPAQYQANASAPEPSVRWIDATHLEIGFHTYVSEGGATAGAAQGCAGAADGVTITCVENRVHAVR